MKPNLLVLLAGLSLSVLTFSSCDKEDVLPATPSIPPTGTPSTTPPPATTSSLLKQFGTRSFRYDAQNRLVELSYSDQQTHGYTVIWEGSKPVRLNFKGGSHYMLYTYTGDKVTEAVTYSGAHEPIYRYAFEYSGDKLVKETNLSYATSSEGRLHIIDYTYDANGNLTDLTQAWSSSSRTEDLGNPVKILWGRYDNKPNPLPYIQSNLFLPGVKLFENNPGFRDEEIYTYSYHESGMPEQRSTKLQSHPHVPSFVERYTY